MMGVYKPLTVSLYSALKRLSKRTANGKYSRVAGIRDYQSKLGASMPSLGRLLGVSVVEINRYSVVWRGIGVTKWKE
jgi:hypothetical protein